MWSMIIMAARSYICETAYMWYSKCSKVVLQSVIWFFRAQNLSHAYCETDKLSSSQGLFCWIFWTFLATWAGWSSQTIRVCRVAGSDHVQSDVTGTDRFWPRADWSGQFWSDSSQFRNLVLSTSRAPPVANLTSCWAMFISEYYTQFYTYKQDFIFISILMP